MVIIVIEKQQKPEQNNIVFLQFGVIEILYICLQPVVVTWIFFSAFFVLFFLLCDDDFIHIDYVRNICFKCSKSPNFSLTITKTRMNAHCTYTNTHYQWPPKEKKSSPHNANIKILFLHLKYFLVSLFSIPSILLLALLLRLPSAYHTVATLP